MSLYSFEEVCLVRHGKCKWAKYHVCEECYGGEPRFCHCEIHQEVFVNHYTGSCDEADYDNESSNKEDRNK